MACSPCENLDKIDIFGMRKVLSQFVTCSPLIPREKRGLLGILRDLINSLEYFTSSGGGVSMGSTDSLNSTQEPFLGRWRGIVGPLIPLNSVEEPFTGR